MPRRCAMAEMTMIEAIRQAMDEELARDEFVFIVGEDVGKRGGVFRATVGLVDKYGGDRVIDSPLAELSIVGVGIGAALYGMHPICEIQFADFIYPAFNQIVSEAAKMCYRSNGAWNVPMVIRAPYGGDVPEGEFTVPIGPAKVTRAGSDLTVFAYGMMHYYTLQAAEKVAGEGIDVEVVDLRTLYPVDKETVLESVRKTSKALIVHEDNLTGGYGGEIAAIIAEEAFTDLDAPVRRLCGPDVPAVPFSHPMQDWFMPNADKIAQAMRDLATF